MLNYFLHEIDEFGFAHSVDNLIIVYDINPVHQKDYLDIMIDSIHNVRDYYKNDINYWERLNVNACSKYSWYCNHIHLDDGIYLSLGHYREGLKERQTFVVFPLLKLEINPNKHYDKPVFHALQKIINQFCVSGTLKKYDYAIDIPCRLSDIKVFNTRKEKGLYKGTVYYGQRNKEGYVKIYDKTKETGLSSPLTRVEHTFDMVKHKKNKSFTPFHVLQLNATHDIVDFSSNDKVIFDLCQRLICAGYDYDDLLSELNFRKRKKITEALNGGYREITFNQELHDKLINKVMEKFNVVPSETQEAGNSDFVELDDNAILPWEE